MKGKLIFLMTIVALAAGTVYFFRESIASWIEVCHAHGREHGLVRAFARDAGEQVRSAVHEERSLEFLHVDDRIFGEALLDVLDEALARRIATSCDRSLDDDCGVQQGSRGFAPRDRIPDARECHPSSRSAGACFIGCVRLARTLTPGVQPENSRARRCSYASNELCGRKYWSGPCGASGL